MYYCKRFEYPHDGANANAKARNGVALDSDLAGCYVNIGKTLRVTHYNQSCCFDQKTKLPHTAYIT